MKRREFLAAPAIGALLPSMLRGEEAAPPPQQTVKDMGLSAPEGKFVQRLHADFNTYIPGVEYFTVGNGDIIGVLQYAPDRTGDRPPTFLGLTIMDAERFARKWSTYLFHPEAGFARTLAGVTVDEKGYLVSDRNFVSVGWKYPETVPVVSLRWKAGECDVEEEIFVPDRGGLLFRRLTVNNTSAVPHDVRLWIGLVPSFAIFDDIRPNEAEKTIEGKGYGSVVLLCPEPGVMVSGRYDMHVPPFAVAPGQSRSILFVYAIRGDEALFRREGFDSLWKSTVAYWSTKPMLQSGHAMLDHLYGVSRTGLRSLTARSGKRDSGFWMYNMEWVRDDVMMILGMLQSGFQDEARTLLVKILENSIGEDGRTIESSRWSGFSYAELDQNGQLLVGIGEYLAWTGDTELVRKYWDRIRRVGDHPLMDVYMDPRVGMMHNKREFWERNDSFGFEDGFEMVYQFWVSFGLASAAEVADVLGDGATAARWRKAAASIKRAMLEDPKFRMVENGRLIKRRTLDGRWQRALTVPNPAAMPPGSPIGTLKNPEAEPDTAEVLPILWGMVDPASDLAQATLAAVDTLWNQRWEFGGYPRYNTDSEPDPPAPWPFASLFVARAHAELRNSEKVWRVLQWLADVHGGKSGGWFERYGPSITPPAPPVCLVGWNWAEMTMLIVRHLMGFRPGLRALTVRPFLLKGLDSMNTSFRVRGSEVRLNLARVTGEPSARVNGSAVSVKKGEITIPYPLPPTVTIDMNV